MEKIRKNIKDIVKDKYSKIAEQSKSRNETSCCGCGTTCDVDYTIFSDDYHKLKGYNPDADLGLGCGLPTEFAEIKPGDTVLDLGSGAGNDCFVARAIVGEKGNVIGIDFTDSMLEKAKANTAKLGFENIEFVKGDIENMPVESESIDVVISNCVLNLVPDKEKAFTEIYRVLKKGAHFCVSDVVIKGVLPEKLQKDAEMYAGCISGALLKDEYLEIIEKNGFRDIQIKKEKEINVPIELIGKYMNGEQIREYKDKELGIYSITVFAKK